MKMLKRFNVFPALKRMCSCDATPTNLQQKPREKRSIVISSPEYVSKHENFMPTCKGNFLPFLCLFFDHYIWSISCWWLPSERDVLYKVSQFTPVFANLVADVIPSIQRVFSFRWLLFPKFIPCSNSFSNFFLLITCLEFINFAWLTFRPKPTLVFFCRSCLTPRL